MDYLLQCRFEIGSYVLISGRESSLAISLQPFALKEVFYYCINNILYEKNVKFTCSLICIKIKYKVGYFLSY